MLDPNGFPWVALYAADLSSLTRFYQHTLGLKVIESNEECSIFDAGAGALLELWGNGVASLSRKGPHEQSMLVAFLVEQLEPAVAQLREKGLEPTAEIGSYMGTRWIHYTDPEGNRFELKDRKG